MKKLLLIISLLPLQALAINNDGIDQSALLYFLRHDCGSCHGMEMNGGLGPPLLPQALQNKPVEMLVSTILEGRPGTAMPPWKNLLNLQQATWMVKRLKKGNLRPTQLTKGELP